ncbi:hypothetical protein [Hydrocarboniphaga effusa]|uniref:hypothetical protein n=1 Tax=Hydrocarboniphaga effusa TaxID=243629 RepID=UPI00398C0E67
MSQPEKKTLTLGKQKDQEAGIEFTLDALDVLLPCRQFSVKYRVAELGSVSLISEFVLRLIRTVDEIEERLIAAFFGFNDRELAFALAELHAHEYVARFDGLVTLTGSGRALFKENHRVPQIFEVQERAIRQGFDLISLAPQDIQGLSPFERRLEELTIRDVARVANASAEARETFRKFFGEISARTDREVSKQLSLYSIDDVVAERRFSAVVPVIVKGSSLRPGVPEVDLLAWRQPQEIEDRSEVVESVVAHVDAFKIATRADNKQAYAVLTEIGAEFLREYQIRDGLSVERYFNEAVTRVGDIRSDRPTIPLVGSVFTPGNNEKLFTALDYAMKQSGAGRDSPGLAWLVPDVKWGFTRVLPRTLARIASVCGPEDQDADDDGFLTVAIVRDKAPFHLQETFKQCERLQDFTSAAPALEILWIPNRVAAVLVHAPIKAMNALPVPLGLLSFDPAVLSRVEAFLKQRASVAGLL